MYDVTMWKAWILAFIAVTFLAAAVRFAGDFFVAFAVVVLRVELDGNELSGLAVPLMDDAGVHSVRVTLGPLDN
jgi:hypothetical protein